MLTSLAQRPPSTLIPVANIKETRPSNSNFSKMAGDVIIYHIDGRLASTVSNGPPIP